MRKKFSVDGQAYGLLLIIEIHEAEMEFARDQGSQKLFELLKRKGHYPYSDLDRNLL